MKSPYDSSPATLAGSGLPPRVTDVLRHLLDLTHAELFPRIDPMLEQLARALYQSAEKSRNPGEQLELLKASQVLREKRSAFARELFRQLESQLASIRRPSQPTANPAAGTPGAALSLTLEEPAEIDIQAQLRELAIPLEGASSLPLYLMGQRFGVLAATPAFSSAQLPLAPQQILEAAATASQSVFGGNIPSPLLLSFFARHVLAHYSSYLEKISTAIEQAGILPGLSFVPARITRSARPADTVTAQAIPSGANPAQPVPEASSHTAAPPAQHVFPPAGFAPVGLTPSQAIHRPEPLSWLRQPALENSPVPPDDAAPDFRQWQQLLSAYRFANHSPQAPRPFAATSSLSHTQVEELLGQLAGQRLPSIQAWQETLQRQIQIRYGDAAGLSRQNTDAMELLSLLVQQINQEAHDNSLVRELLQRLQRPLLYSVMAGQEFFENPAHPARQLLDTIAEYDSEARHEHEADPAFEALIRQVVEQLESSLHPDKRAFEQANQQLAEQLQQQVKRAQANEKRSVEAMQGQERMVMAKNIASDALEALLKEQPVTEALQILLRHAWLDALVLALLRYGLPSQGWSTQLARTEQILAILGEQTQASSQALADEVESAMRRVGYHDEDASAIARQLSQSPATTAQTGGASAEALARRIQAHPRFGMDDASEPTLPPAPPASRNALEDACYQRLCALPFGTWFDFIGEDHHEISRRRLSWYSKLTGNALFVNRRGQKTDIIHLDTLAKMMAAEKVRLTAPPRLVERSLNAAASALQRLLRGNNTPRTTLPA
ncbi:hypothetical protein CO610_04515 [Lysobacteraceae bacterium NML95-0200]|nr:hypothetical protein CO610_04515 [Xanthomonadaceae bacterium NML95-0200]